MRSTTVLSLTAAAIATAFGIAPASAANVFYLSDTWYGSDYVQTFGATHTQTYGELFTAQGAGTLESFGFGLTNDNPPRPIGEPSTPGEPGNVKLGIAEWTAGGAAGATLYTSPVMEIDPSGWTEEFFNGINVALTAGKTYVAYLTTFGIADHPLDNTVFEYVTEHDDPFGQGFVYLDGQDPTGSAVWNNNAPLNLVYQARISVADTPIPAALPLFAGALSALGFLGWCRRRAT